ncbi:PAS domain-containing protein [Sorangium sp. So ce321]|uniref:PAS domain-containing protein n=1 Tax=Sorangium sp. So ce321 TaxID=3133300 RepID=UPI003F60010A
MDGVSAKNRRVLIVDDTESIHRTFRDVLAPAVSPAEFDALDALLFGGEGGDGGAARGPSFELTSAYQGEQALAAVRRSLQAGAPFAVAFVDVRMPPGWDGVETLSRLWAEDPLLQAVICTAYSDCSWDDVMARFGQTDRLLILKKPFDVVEVRQIACALTEKWSRERELVDAVARMLAQEEKHRRLITSLPDMVLRVDREGRCLEVKPPRGLAPAVQPGFSLDGQVGDALPDDVARRLLRELERALADDTTQVFEYEQQVGGELRHYEARIVGLDAAEALVLLRDITERRRAEAAAAAQREQQEIIREQARALEALSMPLIPITEDITVMPLIGHMDRRRMQQVQATLTEGISARKTRVTIVDFTGVPSLGPDVGDEIVKVAQAARLLGTEVVLTGIGPRIAHELTRVGRDLSGVTTRLTLQSGVAFAMAR